MKPETVSFFVALTTMLLVMGLGWIFWHKDIAFGGVLTGIGIVFLILTVGGLIRQRRKNDGGSSSDEP